ncbi:MAG: 30S ribosomal protein S8 [Actinobacteria bacterium]|jgi:small subunit ribosomal protein S8|nr:30S ribosomal protein S8 [Actinomycetota bacterium]
MSYMSDPVADMLARIKNAYTTNMDTVVIPFSKYKADIANILDEEGYIRTHEIRKDEGIQGVIKVHLKYNKNGNCAISGLKRISKPGLRVYAEKDKIPKVLGGLGVVIVSTSKGVLTGSKAKESGIGGEVICSVW